MIPDMEAEPLYLEALEEMQRVLDKDHPNTLNCIMNLALLYQDKGRFEDAEPLYLEAIEGSRSKLGIGHPKTLSYINELAKFYDQQCRYDDAEPLAQELVERTPKDDKKYKARKELLDQIREKLGKDESVIDEDSEE